MEKLFEISYKLRYGETSEGGSEYIKAYSKAEALEKFAKQRKISKKKFKSYNDWSWVEGVWSAEFWNIMQVKEMPCPHCYGTGTIKI